MARVDFGDRQTTERLGRKEPNILIIGCDYHPGFQQIAFLDNETGECGERRLEHVGDAEQFYRDLRARGMEARIGLEASGYTRWFERLVAALGFELWVGRFINSNLANCKTALSQIAGLRAPATLHKRTQVDLRRSLSGRLSVRAVADYRLIRSPRIGFNCASTRLPGDSSTDFP